MGALHWHSAWLRRSTGVVSLVVGTLGTGALLWAINLQHADVGTVRETKSTSISVAPPPKRKTPPKRQQTTPQKNRTTRRAPPPPVLAAGLGSSSFGLDLGAGFGLDGVSDQLLGAADASALVMNEDAVDTLPQAVELREPTHPARARAKGIEGSVVVGFLVDEQGRVQKTRVLSAEPQGVFEEAALDAVATWRFEPATYKGQKVRLWTSYTVRFALN